MNESAQARYLVEERRQYVICACCLLEDSYHLVTSRAQWQKTKMNVEILHWFSGCDLCNSIDSLLTIRM